METNETEFELIIAYERAESGWLTASVPAMPGVITAGRTRDEARANALDALRTMLEVPPYAVSARDTEEPGTWRGTRTLSRRRTRSSTEAAWSHP